MSSGTITEEDVNGFRDKLEAWGSGLEPGEQAVLNMVLVRAFPPGSEPDVEGFIMSPRDAASGLPTGKRTHKPFFIGATTDVGLPTLIGSTYSFPTETI
jgi:hypothetical protein